MSTNTGTLSQLSIVRPGRSGYSLLPPPGAPYPYCLPFVLDQPVGNLGACILHRRCTCPTGAAAAMPVWRLVERFGGLATLRRIVSRMVCEACRMRPTVIIAETVHIEHCGGPPPGWSTVLSTPENPLHY